MHAIGRRSWWVLALRGAAGIVFGILALAWPAITLLTLVLLFAAWALVGGVASVAGALRHRHDDEDWWLPLLLGLVSIGAGALAAFNPGPTALVLVLLMGANALVAGVLDIVAAVRLRRSIRHEWLLALSGLVSVLFGAIVFLYPDAGALALVGLVSAYALLSGALLLVLGLRLRTLGAATEGMTERRVQSDRRIGPAKPGWQG